MASTSQQPQPLQTINPIAQEQPSTSTTAPVQTQPPTLLTKFNKKLFELVFYIQLILISVFSIILTIWGAFSLDEQQQHFEPRKWFVPMLASIASTGLVALAWHLFFSTKPEKALKFCFWTSVFLHICLAFTIALLESPIGLAISALTIVFGVTQCVYTCNVGPRFTYAVNILSFATDNPPPSNTNYSVIVMVIIGVVHSSILVSGIGGAILIGNTIINVLIRGLSLMSLIWTMQVIKNVVIVTVSRRKYQDFAANVHLDNSKPYSYTMNKLMGSVCIGSVLVPFLWLFRVDGIRRRGNIWGFVYVGIHDKGIVNSSVETWDLFARADMVNLIKSDVTSLFCFYCGTSGAAVGAFVAGGWTLAVHKTYMLELSIYGYLIGYFLSRVALAWTQGCVSAYYVAYAENPQDPSFDNTISERIQQLKREAEHREPDPNRWVRYEQMLETLERSTQNS